MREVLYGKKSKLETRKDKQFPNYPYIAVYSQEGPLEGGHASIFIAAYDYRTSESGKRLDLGKLEGGMRYIFTDLQGNENGPAWIYVKAAKAWADPKKSKTCQISQTRAENAIAMALQLARVQSYWSGSSSGVITAMQYAKQHDYHEKALSDRGKSRRGIRQAVRVSIGFQD